MSPQAAWILQDQIIPRLCSAIPKSVVCIGSEDPQELIQDAVVMAARMLDRVEKQGKLGKVTASNISYYTIQHLKEGRRAGGISSVDIMGSATQLQGASRLHSLNEVVSEVEGDEVFELQDVISQDHEDPSVQALRRLDYSVFLAKLNRIERMVVESISAGLTVREICRRVKLTKRKLIELLRKVAARVVECMGGDILREIAQIPAWRIGLDCEREMFACRDDRRH